ncbi:hypothetical protein K438DRAFT_1959463 [Mycena galopus ATCC 62051]|nr:hypothetical protein K438DRAFT_1959463 [Mycena galopus ATCC 62051]
MTNEPAASQETASLVKRLAGPSTGKAGLAKDQEDINRIIADVSKGSKFYENEKKKDKELTKKIEHILHLRDEKVQGVDLQKIEANVDQIASRPHSLSSWTDSGKPFAVGYTVISTASYEARKYGVRSGMATFIAKKLCPQLIMVSHGMADYSEMSHKVMAICKRYDSQMCPAGCDEGYLNITAYCVEHDINADACVEHLRNAVFTETKLTVSAGIAPNTMLAKICSDRVRFIPVFPAALDQRIVSIQNKPNGQFHLPFENEAIKSFMHDLPFDGFRDWPSI